MILLFRFFLFCLLLFFSSTKLIGQAIEPENGNDKYYYITSGYSPSSIRLLGKTPNSQTFILQLGYLKKTKTSFRSIPIYYQISIVPLIQYWYEKRDEGGRQDELSGFGFSPIGFALKKKLTSNLGYVLSTSGGFILMQKKFPTDEGRRLNYTFDLSPSLVYNKLKEAHFSLGYRFHHISNAQTGNENPGLDSNFFYFSIIISK